MAPFDSEDFEPLDEEHSGSGSEDDSKDDHLQSNDPLTLPDSPSSQYINPNLSEDNKALTLSDPPMTQNFNSDLERHFTTIYPFRISLMLSLNRLDFKNIQLAGIRTPVSRELQREYLIPSECDSIEVVIDAKAQPKPTFTLVACTNTTRTVDEIMACYGNIHDGYGVRGRQEKWIEPASHLKHAHGSRCRMEKASMNEGGHFDSFNVCIQCRDRDRRLSRAYIEFAITGLHSGLCQVHCLASAMERPYNSCRCRMFLEKYWQCRRCAFKTIQELEHRGQAFGDVSFPTFIYDESKHAYVDQRTGAKRDNSLCPILGCKDPSWVSGPPEKLMSMCRACITVFPRPQRPAWLRFIQ
ncbi:hypothetical protein MMC29_006422 [Sticta canariensis]|nr:hypothetical protein [Sticta canariensis]